MKYLKLFENYISDFPDVFGSSLIRGVKIDKEEYIDDPKSRKISTGNSNDEDYVAFLENYKNLGLQDPTKSIHFYLKPTDKSIDMMSYYGNEYRILPRKDAKFSFNKELIGGGLGSTWWFMDRTSEELLNKKLKDIIPGYTFDHDDYDDWDDDWNKVYPQYNDNNDLVLNCYEDPKLFHEVSSKYQQALIDGGVVGNLTYDELLDLAKENQQTLQIWTETPVLHKKYYPEKVEKYKNRKLLDNEDFKKIGVDSLEIGNFYKSEYARKIKRLQDNLLVKPHLFDDLKKMALKYVEEWISEK